jgi:hypothetical protein
MRFAFYIRFMRLTFDMRFVCVLPLSDEIGPALPRASSFPRYQAAAADQFACVGIMNFTVFQTAVAVR